MRILNGTTNIVKTERLLEICKNRHTVVDSRGNNFAIVASIGINDIVRLGNYYVNALCKALKLPKTCTMYITGIMGYTVAISLENGKINGEISMLDIHDNPVNIKYFDIEEIGDTLVVSTDKISKSLQVEKLVVKEDKHVYTLERDIDKISLLDRDNVILEGVLTVNMELQATIDITWVTSTIDVHVLEDIIRKFKGYENIQFYR